MKKLIAIICSLAVLVAAFFALRHFGVIGPKAEPERTAPAMKVSEPAASQEPEEPKPEALPPLLTGDPVTVNRQELATVLHEDAMYVPAERIAEAMGLTLSEEDGTVRFTGSEDLSFREGESTAFSESEALSMSRAPFMHGSHMFLPVKDVAQLLKCREYTDEDTGMRYFTPGGGDWEIPADKRLAILEYHAVSNDLWGMEELFVDPADMEEEIVYLLENGYDPIWFEDLRHVEQYDKPVILTFDDGYRDNFTELFPILKKYNCKATYFVIADSIGHEHSMTEEQLRELAASGLVSIQSHGMTHHNMQEMNEEELRYEFAGSRKILTAISGAEPYVVSYPRGQLSELTLQIADEYYKFGTKQTGAAYNTSDNPLLTGRFNIPRALPIEDFIAILDGVFAEEGSEE